MNVADWLEARTIYRAKHGSHAYGTSLPTSDLDIRGVAVPPREYFLGYLHRFEEAEQKGALDVVIFDVRKFMTLAADCNPNVLEILFVDPADRLTVTPQGERLLEHRQLFLSRKAKHTFSGYAMSQLKRIDTHRRWLLSPPKAPPTRAEFGLPERTVLPKDQLSAAESMMRKQIEAWELDLTPLDDAGKIQIRERLASLLAEQKLAAADSEGQWHAAGRMLGFSDNFLDVLDKERRYQSTQRNWEQYQSWVRTRNPTRAQLEAQHGYDCKHGMHLVRLMRMCRELLETGCFNVRRPDAEELLSIRHGAWSYDRLMDWAKAQETDLAQVYLRSPLPAQPDRNAIDALCISIVESML